MSQKFVGLDMKTYSNFRDFVYGLRSIGVTSQDDEFTEAMVLRALHDCSDRIERDRSISGNTFLMTCRARVDARGKDYLEVRVSSAHRPDKFVCLNILVDDSQVHVRENVLDTTLVLPEYIGIITDLDHCQAKTMILAHSARFNSLSLRFFEGIYKEFEGDPIRSQISVNISDIPSGCTITWHIGGMEVFTTSMKRVVNAVADKAPLVFGSKGVMKA